MSLENFADLSFTDFKERIASRQDKETEELSRKMSVCKVKVIKCYDNIEMESSPINQSPLKSMASSDNENCDIKEVESIQDDRRRKDTHSKERITNNKESRESPIVSVRRKRKLRGLNSNTKVFK